MRKMFMNVAIVGALLSGAAAFAHDGEDHSLTQAANLTAAEIAAHRVEKLVLLKKIDSAFQSKFKGLEVENLANGGVGKPTFKITLSQEGDAGAAANKVEITSDSTGKALAHVVVAGVNSSAQTAYSGKDPLTLTEIALHHVEHLAGGDQKIAQFIKPFKALRIAQVSEGGQSIVRIEIVANSIQEKLTMNLKADGTLINAEVK